MLSVFLYRTIKNRMAQIHPSAVVETDAQLDTDVTVGPNCVIRSGASISSGTVLIANVMIEKNVRIGMDNYFYPYSVIGGVPQTLGLGPNSKFGKLVIGDRNVFHEQVTIHPSIYEDSVTRIGNDNLLMVGVHIGHDSMLEDKTVITNYTQIGGHCKIETGAWLSGMVAIHQFVTIGEWSYIAGFAGVNRDVPPFLVASGHYPMRVRGVNQRGLVRAGLDAQQQERICQAYRKLYRRGGALLKNAEALAQEDWLDENVRAMINAIIRSSQHRFGRHLETLRR